MVSKSTAHPKKYLRKCRNGHMEKQQEIVSGKLEKRGKLNQ
jgi:hypothetical protein